MTSCTALSFLFILLLFENLCVISIFVRLITYPPPTPSFAFLYFFFFRERKSPRRWWRRWWRTGPALPGTFRDFWVALFVWLQRGFERKGPKRAKLLKNSLAKVRSARRLLLFAFLMASYFGSFLLQREKIHRENKSLDYSWVCVCVQLLAERPTVVDEGNTWPGATEFLRLPGHTGPVWATPPSFVSSLFYPKNVPILWLFCFVLSDCFTLLFRPSSRQ